MGEGERHLTTTDHTLLCMRPWLYIHCCMVQFRVGKPQQHQYEIVFQQFESKGKREIWGPLLELLPHGNPTPDQRMTMKQFT